jgi:hypothetical protein
MEDREAQDKRAGLVSRLFALLTAKLEDPAAIAAECQARRPNEQLIEDGDKAEELISEATTLMAGIAALLRAS